MATDSGTFPFLQLPVELRVIVYEFLPIRTIRHKFVVQSDEPPRTVELYRKGVPVQILATCSLIKGEATAFLKAKTDQILMCHPHLVNHENDVMEEAPTSLKIEFPVVIIHWVGSWLQCKLQRPGISFHVWRAEQNPILQGIGGWHIQTAEGSFDGGEHVLRFIFQAGMVLHSSHMKALPLMIELDEDRTPTTPRVGLTILHTDATSYENRVRVLEREAWLVPRGTIEPNHKIPFQAYEMPLLQGPGLSIVRFSIYEGDYLPDMEFAMCGTDGRVFSGGKFTSWRLFKDTCGENELCNPCLRAADDAFVDPNGR